MSNYGALRTDRFGISGAIAALNGAASAANRGNEVKLSRFSKEGNLNGSECPKCKEKRPGTGGGPGRPGRFFCILAALAMAGLSVMGLDWAIQNGYVSAEFTETYTPVFSLVFGVIILVLLGSDERKYR